MESLVNSFDLNYIINVYILIGIIFCSLVNLTHSLEIYLLNKAWRVKDYERIIYSYNKGSAFEFTQDDMLIEDEAISNYEKTLKQIEKRKKFFNKFKIKK